MGCKCIKVVLDEVGIVYVGLVGLDEYVIIEWNGLKVGMVVFLFNLGIVSIYNYIKVWEIVGKLEVECDVVIVFFYGGVEGAKYQYVLCVCEIYYGENCGNVYEFVYVMVDVGVDIIFGYGLYVICVMELYNDCLICYSFGNFCIYGCFNFWGEVGIVFLV